MDARTALIYRKMMDYLTNALNDCLDSYEEIAGHEARQEIEEEQYSDWREAEAEYGSLAMNIVPDAISDREEKRLRIAGIRISIAHLYERLSMTEDYFELLNFRDGVVLDGYEMRFWLDMDNLLVRNPDPHRYPEIKWADEKKVLEAMKIMVIAGIGANMDPTTIARELAAKTNEEYKKCYLYISTYKNEFIEQNTLRGYRERGVRQYTVLIAYDTMTCPKCQEMDMKVFNCSEAVVGVNYPPFHPGCRCTTVPVIDWAEDIEGDKAARDRRGRTIYIPDKMTYREWRKKYIDW